MLLKTIGDDYPEMPDYAESHPRISIRRSSFPKSMSSTCSTKQRHFKVEDY
jgi:hypothetical protein